MTIDQLNDEGLLKRVILFDNWERVGDEPEQDYMGQPRLISYQLRTDNEVTLNFYYRGTLLHPNIAKEFLLLVSKPPHQLSSEEQESMSLVLRDAAYKEYFEMGAVRTEILRERTVLVAEGKWVASGLMNLGIFFNADKHAEVIQEIHYLAPPGKFEKHIGEAVASMTSIDWDKIGK